MARKTFEELNLNNGFLFGAVLSDAEACQIVLELILNHSVGKVQVIAEHSLLYSTDVRSVRLDVYASDEMQVGYNIEMQNGNLHDLPKRSRYHQAEMDMTSLKPGEDFHALQASYVIFICTFDPFGYGLYQYTFENRCEEKGFPLKDGTTKIFLNTRGSNEEEVSEGLISFLHYIEDTSDSYIEKGADKQVEKLHEKITALKKSREWRERYMTVEELLRDTEKKGREEGIKVGRRDGMQAGQKRFQQLIARMVEAGESMRIPELSVDDGLLMQMYQKYNL